LDLRTQISISGIDEELQEKFERWQIHIIVAAKGIHHAAKMTEDGELDDQGPIGTGLPWPESIKEVRRVACIPAEVGPSTFGLF
jgi:hypothetical protein